MTTIEKIKNTFKIAPLAARYCGGLRPSGHSKRYMMGWCPQCQQPGRRKKHERPRFRVDTQLQIVKCFKPGCNPKWMDVINLYALMEGIDNDHAIVELNYKRQTGGRL